MERAVRPDGDVAPATGRLRPLVPDLARGVSARLDRGHARAPVPRCASEASPSSWCSTRPAACSASSGTRPASRSPSAASRGSSRSHCPRDCPSRCGRSGRGNRSCGTDSRSQLGPLDRADMVRPHPAAQDRQDAPGRPSRRPSRRSRATSATSTGPRVVVVVTDGAETCDGDPEAAVRSLVEAGFETTVNIVGFALNNEALKERMASWAAGRAVACSSTPRTSRTCPRRSRTPCGRPFRVYDEAGALVGERDRGRRCDRGAHGHVSRRGAR